MSRYLSYHRGSGRQLWETQHAALTQHYQPTRWQKHYDRWQHVDRQDQAKHHQVAYASRLCRQQVDQLSETRRYQQSDSTYQQGTKSQWVGHQADYRYRIATWQQTIKQTWSWQHRGKLAWQGQQWQWHTKQLVQQHQSLNEHSQLIQQHSDQNQVTADQLILHSDVIQLGDGRGCYLYA